jgi:hypothetical protein
MPHSALYDDDILLWSEQQAEIVRRLGRTRRDLPNEFDVENVAEEIESVGRSELAAVENQIQNILVHLIKLAIEPGSDAVRYWRSEIFAFHSDLRRRYAPSMRQRIDFSKIWRLAHEQVLLALPEGTWVAERLPTTSPFSIDDVLNERIESANLAEKLQRAIASSD